jgi:fermentation-respiration switch protein FrsA (DUF1100 family)
MSVVFVIIALVFLLPPFAVALLISRAIHRREKRTYLDAYSVTPWEVGVPFEEVSFRSADGVALRGWWFARPGRRVIVGCSGLNGSKSDLIGIGPYLYRAGFSVLLFDFRDRGESGASLRSAGYFEWRDITAALAYARERRRGVRIGLLGFSMGAALALLASSEPGVAAVVADSSYSSLGELIAERLRRYRLPSRFLLWCAGRFIRLRHGYSLDALAPIDAVRRAGFPPALFIHGGADTIIPAEHSVRLHRASGFPGGPWIVDGAGHCGAYFHDRERYCAGVAAFFRRHLKKG